MPDSVVYNWGEWTFYSTHYLRVGPVDPGLHKENLLPILFSFCSEAIFRLIYMIMARGPFSTPHYLLSGAGGPTIPPFTNWIVRQKDCSADLGWVTQCLVLHNSMLLFPVSQWVVSLDLSWVLRPGPCFSLMGLALALLSCCQVASCHVPISRYLT